MTTRSRRRSRTAAPRRPPVTPILVVSALAVIVLAGLAVLPAKTWFGQRQKLGEARVELARIEAESAALEDELELLETDEEIERRARRDFDLVFPGEESYRILPAPSTAGGSEGGADLQP